MVGLLAFLTSLQRLTPLLQLRGVGVVDGVQPVVHLPQVGVFDPHALQGRMQLGDMPVEDALLRHVRVAAGGLLARGGTVLQASRAPARTTGKTRLRMMRRTKTIATITKTFLQEKRRPDGVIPRTNSSPLPPLVEPHLSPRLHGSRLDSRVGVFEPVPEGAVVRIREVGVILALEGGDLVRDIGQVASYILDDVSVISGPRDRVLVLAHPVRIRQRRPIP
jgi:hypothetical protein